MMTKTFATAVIASALLVGGAALSPAYAKDPSATAAKPMTNADIVALIGKLEIAAVEAKNYDDLKKLYADDVIDFTPSHFVLGFNKMMASFGSIAPQVNNWVVPIVPGSMHIIATSEMAVASSLQVWNADYIDTKKPAMQMFYRQTDVWKKQPDGNWKIVTAHSSIPIDPITERPLCVKADGYCGLPNYPHRGMNIQGVVELNKSYGNVFPDSGPAPAAK